MSHPLEDVIARRVFTDSSTELAREVVLLVERPRAAGQDFACRYFVEGVTSRPREVLGVDSLQALEWALRVARTEIDSWNRAHGSPLRFLGEPDLALLSGLAHGRGPRALEVAQAALGAAGRLDEDRAETYTWLLLRALGAGTRARLEEDMAIDKEALKQEVLRMTREEGLQQGRQQGREEGRQEGRQEGGEEGRVRGRVEARAHDVLRVLAARGLRVPPEVRERVLGRADPERLDDYLVLAATAADARALLEDA